MIKKRYNVMLNPALVARIDYHAKQLDMSRSNLINQIVFDELMNYGDIPDEKDPEIDNQIKTSQLVL